MAADDDFESFRGAIADLDADREQRIRAQFEASRAPKAAAPSSPHPQNEDPSVLQLVPDAETTPPPPRHTRPVLIGVAAAVVLLALVGALTLFRNSGPTADVASGLDDILLSEVAARAAARPDVDLQAGRFLYLRSVDGAGFPQSDLNAAGVVVTTKETWADRDGSGLQRSSSEFVATGPGDPVATSGATEVPINAGAFHAVRVYDEIRALPTTPEALTELVRTRFVAGEDPANAVAFISRLIALETTPPAVRAAGFEALALLGGVPIGRVTTFSGLEGVGYEGPDAYGRLWVVVVDPATTAVIGYAIAAAAGDKPFVDAHLWVEFLEQRIEDGLPS